MIRAPNFFRRFSATPADHEELLRRLSLSPDATVDEIERAYRWLAQKFHPDRNADFQDEAQSRFIRIQEAYEVLSDPLARAQYDETLWRDSQKRTAATATSKTNGSKSRIKKRKKRSLLLSPIWLSTVAGIAALVLMYVLLNNPTDVQKLLTSDSGSVSSHVVSTPASKRIPNPERGTLIGDAVFWYADDFVVNVWQNGKRIDPAQRTMEGEIYGATREMRSAGNSQR